MQQRDYLESLNGELSDKNTYLAVRRDEEWTYIGQETAEGLLAEFPAYGEVLV